MLQAKFNSTKEQLNFGGSQDMNSITKLPVNSGYAVIFKGTFEKLVAGQTKPTAKISFDLVKPVKLDEAVVVKSGAVTCPEKLYDQIQADKLPLDSELVVGVEEAKQLGFNFFTNPRKKAKAPKVAVPALALEDEDED